MKKNETEPIISRAHVTNHGAPAGAKRTSYRPRILSAALAAFFSVGALAQTQLATVFGTITDPSGAVVPGVSVTIVSQGTGLKRSALTDAAGGYRFAGLPTGDYSLSTEKPGFQSHIREGVELTSAAEVMINLQLALGGVSQQTTVAANVAALDNTRSTISGLNELTEVRVLTQTFNAEYGGHGGASSR